MTEILNYNKNNNYLYCSQKEALRAMVNYSVFLTGPAGSGKTHLIKALVKHCYKINKRVAITAMTGSAAYLINGRTLHSWAGIKLGKESKEELLVKIYKSYRSRVNWKYVDILIIDEVSMLTQTLFEKEEIMLLLEEFK